MKLKLASDSLARGLRAALCTAVLGLAACSDDGSGPSNPGATTVPNELQSEARPTSDLTTYFGGDDPADDSGALQYVLIGESGFAFNVDAEVQGLTLEGVGSSTTIDHIQIFGSEDDGIEWFGGTVDVAHFIVQDVDDDGIDFDDGYNGVVQYGIVRMGDTDGDAGIEADNAGPSDDAEPVTRPELANLLIIGKAAKSPGGEGANIKLGFGGDLEHVVFIDDGFVDGGSGGFDEALFDLDNQVDSSLDARGVAYRTASIRDNADADTYEADWAAGNPSDGGAAGSLVYNVQEDTAMTVDAEFQVTTTATLDTTVDTAAAFYGAVDPAATDFASGLWYAGWTVPIGESTALTATDSATPDYAHPLEDDIGTSIVPSTGSCPSGTRANESSGTPITLSVFGQDFKTCIIDQAIVSNTTLTNGFVYILSGNIKVGDGGEQDATNPANVILTIEPGTQIYAQGGSSTLLRITRGSQIFANGTAGQPIIFSAAAMTVGVSNYTITGNPLDLSERGQWGGIVIDGYAPTNSTDE